MTIFFLFILIHYGFVENYVDPVFQSIRRNKEARPAPCPVQRTLPAGEAGSKVSLRWLQDSGQDLRSGKILFSRSVAALY